MSKNAGPKMPGGLSRKRLDHDWMEPRDPEKNRPGQNRPSKRSKQNNQSQAKERMPNVKRASKGNLKDMKELAIEALMDHKVPLKSILDLCPRFKEKVFKNWAEEINQKVNGNCKVKPNVAWLNQKNPQGPGMTMWQKLK